MNKALIDTDIFSDITKGIDQAVAARAGAYRQAFTRYTISAVTLMEIVRGYQRKLAIRQQQALLAAMPSVEVIPFDQSVAGLAGRIAGDLERNGRKIGLADPMIAAIALLKTA